MGLRKFAGLLCLLTGLLIMPLGARAQHLGNAAERCNALQGLQISAKVIGLPTSGALIKTATLIPAAPEHTERRTNFNPTGVTLARPEYCAVTGEIAPEDPAAPPIRFEINLPTEWNGKALHMGGGGFDGVLQTGLGALPRAPRTTPYPIMRGYVTFGSDGGHIGNNASFAPNKEAFINFAYAQLKKTHDVAMQIIKARYGRNPAQTYFAGQSEGGREGLTVAQRFPLDYDGVVVTAPAINFLNVNMRLNRIARAIAQRGGFMDLAKIKLFGASVLKQCDMNDGVRDGIVGNYLGCHYDSSILRCQGGQDTGDACLSDQQLKTLAIIYGPTVWKDSAGKVIMAYPRYLFGGGEASPSDMPAWIFGKAPIPHPQPAGKAMDRQKLGLSPASYYGNTIVRYFIAKDDAFDTFEFDPGAYSKQIISVKNLLASNDPDLGKFYRHGGKLIILQNTADLTVSPVATVNYYEAVSKTLGKATAEKFVRLYVVPGGDHVGLNAPSQVDLLGMLDNWVTNGKAPGSDAIVKQYGSNMDVIRSKPLCAFPYYPRYKGNGDPRLASSYDCRQAKP